MALDLNLIISVLKLTKKGACLAENVQTEARLPTKVMMKLLERYQRENLLKLDGAIVEASAVNRLRLAVKALSYGADIETVSGLLHWREFERIANATLEAYDYEVKQNVHFKHSGRKWEIDIVGCKKPLVVCVDCKSWHRGIKPSAIRRVVDAQIERTEALAHVLPDISRNMDCSLWKRAKFLPVILVLIQTSLKFYDGVPIVSVLQFRDFLTQLPLEYQSMKYFTKDFVHLSD